MPDNAKVYGARGRESREGHKTSRPCVMVIFGASGDLTRRLLVPALYNLACDGLLSENFAVLGSAVTDMTSEQFREQMSGEQGGIRKFHTRKEFEPAAWQSLVDRFYYEACRFEDE